MFYPLTELDKGSYGIISHLDGETHNKCRLSELGFIPGTKVLLISKMPFKGPYIFALHGSKIALRYEQVKKIFVYLEIHPRG